MAWTDYAISPAYGLANQFAPQATQNFMQGAKNTLLGTPGEFKQGPNLYSPQQQEILNRLLQQGSQGLGYDAIEGAARRGYQNSTIPMLSERFANIGGRGLSGRGSSGYQNAIQDEGTLLESQLAKGRQENSMNLLNLGLTQQSQPYYQPGKPGILGDLIKGGVDLGAAYLSGGATAPASAASWLQKLYGNGGGQDQQQPQFMGQQGSMMQNQSLRTPQYQQLQDLLQQLSSSQGAMGAMNNQGQGMFQGQQNPYAQASGVAQGYQRLSRPQQQNAANNLNLSPGYGFQREFANSLPGQLKNKFNPVLGGF